MGFFDEIKKLTRPYDEEDDEFIDEAEAVAEPVPEKRSNPFSGFGGGESNPFGTGSAAPARPKNSFGGAGRVVNLNSSQLKVVLIRPERFELAAQIADHLRDKHAVVMNLESTPKDVSRRLIDFLSGVAYALDGKIKKVAASTYIITPYNVDLSGDQMDELENGSVFL